MKTNPYFVGLLILCAGSVGQSQEVPVKLPAGFSIKKVAGNELVPDASAMTVDSAGTPVVSGPGYVRRVLDSDKDGVYDQFETLAKTKGIAQGICFEGEQLWLTVDGALKRSVSRQSGQPYVFEDVVRITTDAEHGSHAIRKGPDGWWYVICGNATEIRAQYHSLDSTPIDEPRAGFVMRFPPDVETGEKFAAEVFCHGFRNAYDFDFDTNGRMFVYDSDGERDVSLPWYRPTRVFKMRAGDDAGWVSAGWKRPASFIDMPMLVGELGRGSPTGVVACDGRAFGKDYEEAVFFGDWTFGRIVVSMGGTDVKVFAKPTGNFGFAITDLEFAGNGDLLVTTGGRGTEGSLYRISRDIDGDAETELQETVRRKAVADAKKRFVELMRKRARQRPTQPGVETIDGKQNSNLAADFIQGMSNALDCADALVAANIRSLQLDLGGCDGDRMFAGHQAKKPYRFEGEDGKAVAKNALALLQRGCEKIEVARLVGMLQLHDDLLANELAEIVESEKDPVLRIHYLNCLATAKGKLDSDSVKRVSAGLLNVRREIDAAELPVDRNWIPRMQQLARELFRDMRVPESIVRENSFGLASDVWIYDLLPEIFRDIAKTKIAAKIQGNRENVSKAQLQCLSGDAKYLDLIRTFADDHAFTDLVVRAVSIDPKEGDRDVLLRGLKSFNLTVNKSSLMALKKLGKSKEANRADIEAIFELERRLGWTNPEVSVRDQVVLVLRKWSGGSSLSYELRKYAPAPELLNKQRMAIGKWRMLFEIRSVDNGEGQEKRRALLHRIAAVDFSVGDVEKGKSAYQKFQCSSCHNGRGQNSGPSLAGVTSRFSREDVFRAIVDPSENVPDRYRSVVIATEDGQLYRGSVVYESMAGVMLSIGSGEVVRIAPKDIESRRKSKRSLMPEGLIDDASDQEIADLWAYLNRLK